MCIHLFIYIIYTINIYIYNVGLQCHWYKLVCNPIYLFAIIPAILVKQVMSTNLNIQGPHKL